MNKEIIENYMEQVWNKKNLSIIDDVFAETAVIHSPLGQMQASSAMAETVQKWITAIPNIRVDLLHTAEENDVVFSHWRAKGTPVKSIKGFEASATPIEYRGVSMYRLKDGKVVEYWAYVE